MVRFTSVEMSFQEKSRFFSGLLLAGMFLLYSFLAGLLLPLLFCFHNGLQAVNEVGLAGFKEVFSLELSVVFGHRNDVPRVEGDILDV